MWSRVRVREEWRDGGREGWWGEIEGERIRSFDNHQVTESERQRERHSERERARESPEERYATDTRTSHENPIRM